MSSCQECIREGPIVTLTSLGAISNPAFKVSNSDAFEGARIVRSDATHTILTKHSIEWIFLNGDDASLIISVGNGVKTVPVSSFYKQNAQFDKLEVKTDHVGCQKKLANAGVNVI